MLTSIAVSLLLLAGSFTGSHVSMASGCDTKALTNGACSSTDGARLTITGTQQKQGSPPSRSTPGDEGPSAPRTPSPRSIALAKCLDDGGTTRCADLLRPTAELPTPGPAPAAPTVTIADLQQFAPPVTSATVEPGGIGVAGLPANFSVAASTHTVAGSLLGLPVLARFTPVAYEYSYGDGTSASLTTPGRSWADLGQAQFTPTPTSHVYRLRGVYFADVDVRYTAEVDLGGGWMPVTGEVRTDGPPQRIRVLEARTALVAHTCTERRDAPGC
ncbi:hypothetical protein MRBLWO14_003388 [Microbacterium sp. LWO14-1.2]|uniref:hypothetical protein n=1 Tax=Microbacterium sp. LWO14-1.2 TaxID=3135263 RepID=UPI0031388792